MQVTTHDFEQAKFEFMWEINQRSNEPPKEDVIYAFFMPLASGYFDMDRAMKHFMIAAKIGCDASLEEVSERVQSWACNKR